MADPKYFLLISCEHIFDVSFGTDSWHNTYLTRQEAEDAQEELTRRFKESPYFDEEHRRYQIVDLREWIFNAKN